MPGENNSDSSLLCWCGKLPVTRIRTCEALWDCIAVECALLSLLKTLRFAPNDGGAIALSPCPYLHSSNQSRISRFRPGVHTLESYPREWHFWTEKTFYSQWMVSLIEMQAASVGESVISRAVPFNVCEATTANTGTTTQTLWI